MLSKTKGEMQKKKKRKTNHVFYIALHQRVKEQTEGREREKDTPVLSVCRPSPHLRS